FQSEAAAVVPKQQIARASEHAHALQLRAGNLVAALAVRDMQPQHVGLGAQAKVLDNGPLYRSLGTSAAAGHDRLRCWIANDAVVIARARALVCLAHRSLGDLHALLSA